MHRVHDIALRLLLASLVLCGCFAANTFAQTPSASPAAQEPAKAPDRSKENEANPFAPEPGQPLPPGFTGPDTNDPRAKLTPGVYDAGEAAMGIKHLLLVK